TSNRFITTASFLAADVDATTGDNVIELRRQAGDGTGNWIQFDFIRLESVMDISTAQGTVVADGATLAFAGVNYSHAEPVTSAGTIVAASGNSTFPGPITLTADNTINVPSGTSLTLNGAIDDGANAYGLTKIGGG